MAVFFVPKPTLKLVTLPSAPIRGLTLILMLFMLGSFVHAKTAPDTRLVSDGVFEDAMARANAGDYAGAVIQLRNVLQADPSHLSARIALGKYLVKDGKGASAEKELRYALSLGAVPENVLPILGNALLLQRKPQEILDTIKSNDPAKDGTYEMLLLRARAHYDLGNLDDAQMHYEKAAQVTDDQTQVNIGFAKVARSRGDLPGALAYAEKATDLSPSDPEAWFQLGETLRASGQSTDALASFDRALAINPNLLRVRVGRALEYLVRGRYQKALDDTRFVRAANPRDLMAAFIEWRALSGLGEARLASAALSELGQGLSLIREDTLMAEPYLLRLAAWFSLARRDLVRCERYLTRFVELNPHDPQMQILLGRVNLMLDDPKAAISVLHPLAKRYPTNVSILSPLGQAYFAIGNYDEAAAMFERANEYSSSDERMHAELALSRIGTGRGKEAVEELESIVQSDSSAFKAGLLLAVLQFKSGELELARETITQVIEQRPHVRAYNLLGIILTGLGRAEEARAAFQQTLAIQPDHVPAIYNLAKLDIAERNFEAAEARFRNVVDENPRSAPALLGLADIALGKGQGDAAANWLAKAATAAPDNTDIHVRRVDLLLELDRKQNAHDAAKFAIERRPENPELLIAMGKVYHAMDRADEAQRSFRNAMHYIGFNGPTLLEIAQLQVSVGDFSEARKTLIKATQAPMVATPAAGALVRLDIRMKKFDLAKLRIDQLAKAPENEALVHNLKGTMLAAQGDPSSALEEFEAAHIIEMSSASMLALFDALDANAQRDEAIKRLEDWSDEHPDDIEAQRKLALWYLPTRQLDKAKALHEKLLQQAPNDPLLLSNLARFYQLEKDSRARSYAERAVSLRPEWAVALDTLGWILVTEGEIDAGLKYLRDAIARSNNPLIRYHLAQALSEQGRYGEAKIELKRVLNSASHLQWIDDVKAYYDRLVVEADSQQQ